MSFLGVGMHKVDLRISIVWRDRTLQAKQCKLPFFLRARHFRTEALQNITQFFIIKWEHLICYIVTLLVRETLWCWVHAVHHSPHLYNIHVQRKNVRGPTPRWVLFTLKSPRLLPAGLRKLQFAGSRRGRRRPHGARRPGLTRHRRRTCRCCSSPCRRSRSWGGKCCFSRVRTWSHRSGRFSKYRFSSDHSSATKMPNTKIKYTMLQELPSRTVW